MADTTGPTTVHHYCLQLLVTLLFTSGHTTAHHCCLTVHDYCSHYCSPQLLSLLVTLPRTIVACSLLALPRTIAVYLFATLVKLLFTITVLTIGRHYWPTTVHQYCLQLLVTLLFTSGNNTAHHCCLLVRDYCSHYCSPLLVSLLVTLTRTIVAYLFTSTGKTNADHY